jgi:hypothetical protein
VNSWSGGEFDIAGWGHPAYRGQDGGFGELQDVLSPGCCGDQEVEAMDSGREEWRARSFAGGNLAGRVPKPAPTERSDEPLAKTDI